MPTASMLTYFKTYFNITTQPYFIAKDSKLQAFLTAHAGNILTNDPAFSSNTSLVYAAFSGNIKNDVSTTQKWVQPVTLAGTGPLLLPAVHISMILYKNDGITEELLLRVTNGSIDTDAGYPGIVAGGGMML